MPKVLVMTNQEHAELQDLLARAPLAFNRLRLQDTVDAALPVPVGSNLEVTVTGPDPDGRGASWSWTRWDYSYGVEVRVDCPWVTQSLSS